MKKKSQPDNIRHLKDYRKTAPAPSGASRPADASYGYSREPVERNSGHRKKGKTGKQEKEEQKKKSEKEFRKTEKISSKGKRGQPLGPKRQSPAPKTAQPSSKNSRGRASGEELKKASAHSKASPPVLAHRKDKYRWVTVFLMILLFSVCALVVGVIGRNAEISKIRLEIGKLEKQVTEEKNKVKELKMKLEISNRTDYIEEKARRELGMDYIRDDQVVYIDVE